VKIRRVTCCGRPKFRELALRRRALEIGDLDVEGAGQQASRTHERRVARFDPPQRVSVHTEALGESFLGEATLDAPVGERRQDH
jgi:hypothetical protein